MYTNTARQLWLRVETIHAVTYFDEVSTTAARELGVTGFWMGYFGFRAAPMGPVGCGVVEATFSNFAPTFVRRWVPEVWDRATPDALLVARREAAADALRRLCPAVEAVAADVRADLETIVGTSVAAGRPLFAANRRLPVPDDPVEALWQLCTSIREHRGDGHVATLTAAGLDGLEAHVLIALEQGNSPEDLQRARGWTADDWSDAVDRLVDRGLVYGGGELTEAGRDLRVGVEVTTDRVAGQPIAALGEGRIDAVLGALDPLAAAIADSGVIRYPNPMGLPRFEHADEGAVPGTRQV